MRPKFFMLAPSASRRWLFCKSLGLFHARTFGDDLYMQSWPLMSCRSSLWSLLWHFSALYQTPGKFSPPSVSLRLVKSSNNSSWIIDYSEQNAFWNAFGVVDILIDLAIVSLPTLLLHDLQIGRQYKVPVILAFSCRAMLVSPAMSFTREEY